jgi:hypothetical protein
LTLKNFHKSESCGFKLGIAALFFHQVRISFVPLVKLGLVETMPLRRVQGAMADRIADKIIKRIFEV